MIWLITRLHLPEFPYHTMSVDDILLVGFGAVGVICKSVLRMSYWGWGVSDLAADALILSKNPNIRVTAIARGNFEKVSSKSKSEQEQ